MRVSLKGALSWKTAVIVCSLEVLSAFALQNETTNTSLLPQSRFNLSSSKRIRSHDARKFQDITYIVSNAVGNELFVAAANRSKKHRRRKNRTNRRRRKGLLSSTASSIVKLPENQLSSTTTTVMKRKRKRKHRRRKNKKYRRRQKLDSNNILEVTTAKGVVFPTNTSSNSTINELIRKLNQNPEDNFEDFQQKQANKTLDLETSNGQNAANLVAPMPPAAHYPIPLNENITLHISVDNNTNHRNYPRKYNRCRKNKGGCAHYCNPRGKTKCSCIKGFILAEDQKSCLDMDECEINNGGCEMKCLNTLGSYECRCSSGLRLSDDLKFCEDVNECLLRNGHGHCQDTCENTYGSYKCSCEGLNGTKLSEDGHTCVDLDECMKDNGGCSHECINTVGRAFCMCPDGMKLSSDWKTCQDLNECDDETIQKLCNDRCINTEGSYRCADLFDYQSDEATRKIACKPLFPPRHGFITCSRDGATHTYTKTGRRRIMNSPGTMCELVCPVGYRMTGEFYVTCGFYGQWEGRQEAKCLRIGPPTLECPPDQTFMADQDSNIALVEFPSPKTNVNWKYVKSYPPWAKNLTGTLKEGRHDIHFTVTDHVTKLVSSCSFKVIVRK